MFPRNPFVCLGLEFLPQRLDLLHDLSVERVVLCLADDSAIAVGTAIGMAGQELVKNGDLMTAFGAGAGGACTHDSSSDDGDLHFTSPCFALQRRFRQCFAALLRARFLLCLARSDFPSGS